MSRHLTDDTRWVRRFHPAPNADTRLVCFPHAGGSASYYFPVSRALSPAVDVLALQYPGRQDRRDEPCIDDLNLMADHVAEALSGWTDRPLALFGHSLGAALAYEVALRLQSIGVYPVNLFVSGRRAPSTRRFEAVHLRPDAALIEEIRGLSGTDSSLLDDADLLRMVLPALRGDYRAIETYQHTPGDRVDVPIVALVGDNDPKATIAEVTAWREHTTADFTLRTYPGGHFYLNEHASAVIRLISAAMADAGRLLLHR